jgi:hypothetical protein
MLSSPLLQPLSHIRHGFFTRHGGVSNGIYASLNCGPGSGDDLSCVAENRRRVQEALAAHTLITCHQIHSAQVVMVDTPWKPKDAPQADALVTTQRGIALGVLTADCLPVLFADREAAVIGAAHAGWKGAIAGILEQTLSAMEALGARRERIWAAIGPAIAQKSYEVGGEFRDTFLSRHPAHAAYFIPASRTGHWKFDLPGFARDQLAELGLTNVNLLERDTCFEEDTFFSFRRATLKGEPSYGRQISAITLTPSPF